jgi:hypothetical protein
MGIWFKKKRNARPFILLIAFPLPIVFISAYIFYNGFEDPENYRFLVNVLTSVSVFTGVGVVFHCIIDRKKRDVLFWIRASAVVFLLLGPLTILFPELNDTVLLGSMLISGILLGTYGYLGFYSGKRVGILYSYASIFFMVIAPIIALGLAKIYLEATKDELLYRRPYDGWVTCHAPAFPPFFFEDPDIPALATSGFLGLGIVLQIVRKKILEKKLKNAGVIPPEFYYIREGKDDET